MRQIIRTFFIRAGEILKAGPRPLRAFAVLLAYALSMVLLDALGATLTEHKWIIWALGGAAMFVFIRIDRDYPDDEPRT